MNCRDRKINLQLLKILLFPGILTIVFLLSTLYSDFSYINIGARSSGLGAFTALADDPHAVFYNPAGLNKLTKLEFSSTYGLLLYGLKGSEFLNQQIGKELEPGLTENVITVAIPIEEIGTTGLGWYNLSLGRFYSENMFYFSFGKTLMNKLPTGISLKILNKEFGRDIYTEQFELFKSKGYTKSNFSLDLGGIYNLRQNWQIGILIKDILQPNISLSNTPEDSLPLQLRLGIAGKKDAHRFTTDIIYDLISNNPKRFMIVSGIEYVLFNKITLRATLGAGNKGWYNFASGFGVIPIDWLKFHYAFNYPITGLKNVLTHRLSLEISFDIKKKPAETTKPKPEESKRYRKKIIR